MDDEWQKRILQLRYRTDEKEDIEFVELVEKAIGHCDLDTCRVLMKTFVTDEDYGVQESVVSALSSAATEDYQIALVQDFPRLIVEAPEWAEVLVEREIMNNISGLRNVLTLIPLSTSRIFTEFVSFKFPDFNSGNI